jgi:DNA-directed RNA polymerase specialized sigma24 family protein
MACWRFGTGARIRRTSANSAAFERIYVEHEHALFGYLVRRFDRATAEIAVAEVLARAWQDFATRDTTVDERVWIFGLALEHLEQHRAAELAHLEDLAVRPNAPISSGQRRHVARALADLDPLDRDLLTLHVWAGVEHESLGELTGLPAATARRRVDRAHAFVRRRAGAA